MVVGAWYSGFSSFYVRDSMSKEFARNTSDSDVKSIDGERNQTRRFPHNTLGSKGHAGAQQTFREVLANSLDEAQNGRASWIKVDLYKDGSVRVSDDGAGVPLAYNEAKDTYNWKLIYTRYYAGTKYGDRLEELQAIYNDVNRRESFSSKNSGDFDVFGLGAHGMGLAATQFTSDFMEVESKRGGYRYFKAFKDGEALDDNLLEEPLANPSETGTSTYWRPSDEVFNGQGGLTDAWVRQECYDMSLVKGIAITYTFEGEEPVVFNSNDFSDALEGKVTGVSSDTYINWSNIGGKYHVTENTVCLGATIKGTARKDIYFQNNMRMNGGLQEDAVNSAIQDFFSAYRDDDGVLIRFSQKDYDGLITVALSTYAVNPNFPGQTKSYLDFTDQNMYIGRDIHTAVLQTLNKAKAMGAKWLVDVVEEAKQAQEARALVAYHRSLAREVKKSTSSKKPITSQKFVSCSNYEKGNYRDVEIYFVEGDSAGGSVKQGRDSDTQALIYMGGKMINGYKASIEELLQNKSVQLILQVLGTGVDLGLDDVSGGEELFDLSKAKFGKIYLLTDGDIDGLHIRMLVFTILYRLVPKVLDAGMLHILDAPLYMVKENGVPHYFYSGEEYASWCEEKPGREKYKPVRYKGLGQMNASDVHNSLMRVGGIRRVTNVEVDTNEVELVEALETLFGNVANRREIIINQLLDNGLTYSDIKEQLKELDDLINESGIESGLEYQEVTQLVAN